MTTLLTAARIIFGLLFAAASLDKIVHPEAFATIIHNYRLMPEAVVPALAILLPWVELVCGLSLALGRLRLGAAAILCGLMATFMAALSFNWYRGLDVACGCFTVSAVHGNPAMALARDAALLLLGVVVLWDGLRTESSRVGKAG